VVEAADKIAEHLTGDAEVYENPYDYFDQLIEINLSDLEPQVNGPFTPDRGTPISKLKAEAIKNEWPLKVEWGLIGSCTNSSYEDMARAASIVEQAVAHGITPKAEFGINPGSEQVRYTIERDGIIATFEKMGTKVFTNACGPCIGQWDRAGAEKQEKNTIIHSFNRNFSKRADGNPNTHAFVTSPEMVAAIAIAGDLGFNPLTDTLTNDKGEQIKLLPPHGDELPRKGFAVDDNGYQAPAEDGSGVTIAVAPDSSRLQLLENFPAWNGKNIMGAKLLIKAKGKCTTDHISMAGPWLRYRGHLDNISNNMLIGAENAFNGKANAVTNQLTGEIGEVPAVQRAYKAAGIPSIVVGDHNYGEGSSREHAAMEPRHLGVCAVIVKSFARIHETNLKKQGMLGLTFANENDYDKIREDDTFNFTDLEAFAPGKPLSLELVHANGSKESILLNHSYNDSQIEWFKAGSALNLIKMMEN
jgi:aconitate hydratase